MNMAEVYAELKHVKKRDEELSFRANKTYDYLGQLDLLSPKDAQKLYKELDALKVPRLKPLHMAKIIDLLPKTVDELKIILQGYTLTINKDNSKRIIDTVVKFI